MRRLLAWLSTAVVLGVVAVAIVYPTIPAGPVDLALTPDFEDAAPLTLVGKGGGAGQIEATVPRGLRSVARSSLKIRIGTYLKPPTADVVVDFLDRAGTVTTRCSFPHTSYRDAVPVTCPRSGRSEVSRVRISASDADGELAVFGSKAAVGNRVGRWYKLASGGSWSNRIAFAEGAVNSLRPSPFRVPLLLAAILLSACLLVILTRCALSTEE